MAFTTEEITITAASDIRDGTPIEILEKAILRYNETETTDREESRLFGDCLKVIDFASRTLWKPADDPIVDAITQGLESLRDSVETAVKTDELNGDQIAAIATTVDAMEEIILSIRASIDSGFLPISDTGGAGLGGKD